MRAPLLLVLLSAAVGRSQAAPPQDGGDDIARPRVTYTVDEPDLVVRQYQLGCLSHLSYLVVSHGVAAVIDPQRDVDHYLRDAAALQAVVRFVLLTHLHADFVAGHLELHQRTGAEIAISRLADVKFPHRALDDSDRIEVGDVTLQMWSTPGHTPHASIFLLAKKGAAAPAWAFTGDTLFVGSIGRPDLLEVPPAELASQAFDSVQRLKTLPDSTVVLPAHGAGSLCGAHLSPETTSTIGAEKANNPFLRLQSRATFIANVISNQPVAPRYFAFNVALNRDGPPLVDRAAAMPPARDAAAVRDLLAHGGWVVDLRDQRSYAAGHVPGSVNIALRGRLDTWTGIVVPVDAQLVLLGADAEVAEGSFRLRRIGYDRLAGFVQGGIDGWRRAGGEVRQSRLFTPQQLHAAMQAGKEPIIVDVRTRDEYEDVRLGDVGNLPVTESERFAQVLAKDQPVVMVCNSAYRSSMAVGMAERLGLQDVGSLDGGLDAWIEAGLPVVGRMAPGAAAPAARTGQGIAQGITLPEPVDAALLARVLVDQPQAYAVLDLRPAWQFREWSIPGSLQVALAALEEHVNGLPAALRVVLVDRDGSTAFAAAGALLARNPDRPLRVLLGGVQNYYRETQFGGGAGAGPALAPGAPAPSPAPAAPKPKKRGAGC